MSKPKVVGIGLNKEFILIHYVDDDELIDEKIVAVNWKKNPSLQRLVQAFAEASSQYILGGNKSLDKLDSLDLDRLFKDLLDENMNQ